MDPRSVGLWAIVLGAGLLIVGLILYLGLIDLSAKGGIFGWFGRLPGDIRIDRGNTKVFFPLTSMLLVSGVVTIVLNLMRRL